MSPNAGLATIQSHRRRADDKWVDAAMSGLFPGVCGLVLIGLALVSFWWISPTVRGQFFDSHPILRSAQRISPPAPIALVGMGLVAFALTR